MPLIEMNRSSLREKESKRNPEASEFSKYAHTKTEAGDIKKKKKRGETYTANPLGVTFQTPLSLNSLIAPPSAACSTNLASKKSLHVNLATSRFIRKVVVVVVVIILR